MNEWMNEWMNGPSWRRSAVWTGKWLQAPHIGVEVYKCILGWMTKWSGMKNPKFKSHKTKYIDQIKKELYKTYKA